MHSPCIDDPDLPLGALMAAWPETISVFLRHRMLCVGCLVNGIHTLDDACREYGLRPESFLCELKQAITERSAKPADAPRAR